MADNNNTLSEIVDALADEVSATSGIEAAVTGMGCIDEEYCQGVRVLLQMHRERLGEIMRRIEALAGQPLELVA